MTGRRGGESIRTDVDGPVHRVDFGGEGTPIVLVHGLGGSHLNWSLVARGLAELGRVVAVDLPGFGITPPAGRSLDVRRQAAFLDRFIAECVGEPAVVVGNSLGGLIGLYTAAADVTGRLGGLVLVDAALPPMVARMPDRRLVTRLAMPLLPFVGPRLVRSMRDATTPAQYVDRLLAFVAADAGSVPAAYRAAAIEFEEVRRTMPWAEQAFVDSGRSLAKVVAGRAGFRRAIHRIGCPVLVVHGAEDRLVQVESARWLAAERPDWQLEILHGVGHVPQIEAPDRFSAIVEQWTARTGVLQRV